MANCPHGKGSGKAYKGSSKGGIGGKNGGYENYGGNYGKGHVGNYGGNYGKRHGVHWLDDIANSVVSNVSPNESGGFGCQNYNFALMDNSSLPKGRTEAPYELNGIRGAVVRPR